MACHCPAQNPSFHQTRQIYHNLSRSQFRLSDSNNSGWLASALEVAHLREVLGIAKLLFTNELTHMADVDEAPDRSRDEALPAAAAG